MAGEFLGANPVAGLADSDQLASVGGADLCRPTIGGTMLGRARFEPGWRWSNDVKPIAKTDWWMFLHEGSCVSGSAIVQAEDGSQTRIGPGDGHIIQPGHDAWVLGDEPWVTIDFSQQMGDYAKPS